MREKMILTKEVTGELVEKKSRFIATMVPVNDETEAAVFIEKMKKQYWDARHNCSAFVIGDNNELTRCSDDGEPSGTAGRPMLEVLTGSEIRNVAVVVTRYFGGVLLGTGGLVRAYQGAVKEAIEEARSQGLISTIKKGIRYVIVIEYNDLSNIQKTFENNDYRIYDTIYTDKVTIDGIFPLEKEEEAVKKITDVTSGRAVFDKIGECEYKG